MCGLENMSHGSMKANLVFWKLTSDQEALLHVFGFQHIDQIRFLRHDRDLILSLVECLWPERNTFQLPFGEMSIVLKDVANILGLPITGEPIIFDESFSAETAIMEYLGVVAPKLKGKRLVTYTWLRKNFMHIDRIGDEEISVNEERVIACTRAYLLGLISAVMFPDSSERVNLRFMPFLKDLTEPTIHAWGASVLAYLYSTMSDFVRFQSKDKLMKNLNRCVTLIQVWSYEHFSIGRPVSRISSDTHVFPTALRWITDAVDPAHCVQSVAPIYRGQFDSLQISEVNLIILYSFIKFIMFYYLIIICPKIGSIGALLYESLSF
ncbi:uncharacterized protein M6B38_361720 [Iris pallida]|uniref:Aminotransferase-like plant mobile domain-containing protein n=1 Tax=Iris pallida TaxID=29817 RepID=A0AAX6GK05_IRIPA|nr:uncharacterized protein M6B38_361720 [Iris pallida]